MILNWNVASRCGRERDRDEIRWPEIFFECVGKLSDCEQVLDLWGKSIGKFLSQAVKNWKIYCHCDGSKLNYSQREYKKLSKVIEFVANPQKT